MKKVIIVFVILISLFSLPSYASNTDEYYEDCLEASGAKELSDYLSKETSEYLEKLGLSDIDFEKMSQFSLGALADFLLETARNGIDAPIKGFMTASGTVLLVSVCSAFFPDDEKSRMVLNIISGCMIAVGVFLPSAESLKAVASAIEGCCAFEKALIPVLAGVVAVSGNPALSLTYKTAAFAAAEFVALSAKNFAMPLVGISGALGITGAMMPTLRLTVISDAVRKTMTTVLAFAASLFTGFLSLRGILSVSADGLATKGIKLATNTFVPVIGGAIGEAYSSVIGSLGLLKNTVAIYAVVAIFVICIPVIINLALWAFAMRAAFTVSELLDCRVCSDVLKSISFVFSMFNTLLIFIFVIFVISTGLVVALKSGG